MHFGTEGKLVEPPAFHAGDNGFEPRRCYFLAGEVGRRLARFGPDGHGRLGTVTWGKPRDGEAGTERRGLVCSGKDW